MFLNICSSSYAIRFFSKKCWQYSYHLDLFYFADYADANFLATIVDDIISPVPSPITFNEKRINPGGHFDNATGTYTVPLDGTYEFYFQVYGYPDVDFIVHLYVDDFEVALIKGSDYGSETGNVHAVSQVFFRLFTFFEVVNI